MASNRFLFLVGAVSVGATSVLVACVGSDPGGTVVTDQDAATNGDTSTASDGGATDSQVATDTGIPPSDAGSAECIAYCAEFQNSCGFSTSMDQNYADTTQCLAICATMTESGLTNNSVACRARNLPDAGDCPAGGPWGSDNQTSVQCGSAAPCTAICAAVTPKCAAAGAALSDCLDFCGNQAVGDVSEFVTCMETKALVIYQTGSSTSGVAAHCADFQACN